jgi:pyruvate dehydrogenase E2 component (dihydrolipoamide acetyltransferase)
MTQTASPRIFVSPLARRLAREKGIDLSTLRGSGPHGRIVRADLDKAPMATVASAGAGKPMANDNAGEAKKQADLLGMPYREEKLSAMRKTIARRLSESKQTVPHFYLTVECRLDALMAARAQINEAAKDKYKLSVNDFIIKACALALRDVPAANAAWNGDSVLYYDRVDVSVAVATPTGLITPIIMDAPSKGLATISAEMKDLAARARDGKLKPQEYQGGTFSLSNLGMFGIKHFQAIINPPQACILAVGAGEKKPVVNDKGVIEVATVMSATLSVDHRVVDGAVGAEWLVAFKKYLETPMLMVA